MLFAAGFGTRMRPLTDTQPKPLIPVAGRPLIDHAMAFIDGAEISKTVVNLHYRADQLAAHLQGKPIETVTETPDILDTGGGLRNALPLLGDGPILTLNTDAVWAGPNPLALLQQAWDPARMDALLICVPMAQVHGRTNGDFDLGPDGHITRGQAAVYGGAQIIKTTGLHDIPDRAFSLNVLWNQMAAQNRLFGLPYPGQWCDVGHPAGIQVAEDMLAHAHV